MLFNHLRLIGHPGPLAISMMMGSVHWAGLSFAGLDAAQELHANPELIEHLLSAEGFAPETTISFPGAATDAGIALNGPGGRDRAFYTKYPMLVNTESGWDLRWMQKHLLEGVVAVL